MSLQPADAAIVDHLIQQMRGFPKSRNARERRITYDPHGRVQRLNLSRLGLTQLPTELGQLSHLQVLLLARNSLTQLPAELGQLSQLTYLDLSNNPKLQSPPPAVVAEGTQAILAYLRALQEQE